METDLDHTCRLLDKRLEVGTKFITFSLKIDLEISEVTIPVKSRYFTNLSVCMFYPYPNDKF